MGRYDTGPWGDSPETPDPTAPPGPRPSLHLESDSGPRTGPSELPS